VALPLFIEVSGDDLVLPFFGEAGEAGGEARDADRRALRLFGRLLFFEGIQA